MKIAVTGSSGFIGRALVKVLNERGHQVLEIGRSGSPAIDLHSWEQVDAFLQKEQPEGLIHLAWETEHGAYWSSDSNLKWVASSLHLAESFAKAGGKRLIVAGTCAEYKWGGVEDLLESTSLIEPDSLYGISKNALREILQSWAAINDVSFGWARLFNPFGTGEKSVRLVPKIKQKLRQGEIIEFDSGSLVRDFIHVDDLAGAFADFYDSEVEGPVNLASGEGVTIRTVVSGIANALNRTDQVRFDVQPDPSDQPLRVVADNTILKQNIGWVPKKTLLERIEEFCQEG